MSWQQSIVQKLVPRKVNFQTVKDQDKSDCQTANAIEFRNSFIARNDRNRCKDGSACSGASRYISLRQQLEFPK